MRTCFDDINLMRYSLCMDHMVAIQTDSFSWIQGLSVSPGAPNSPLFSETDINLMVPLLTDDTSTIY